MWCNAKYWSDVPKNDWKELIDTGASALTLGLKMLFYDLGNITCGKCGFNWDGNVAKNSVKCPECRTTNVLR